MGRRRSSTEEGKRNVTEVLVDYSLIIHNDPNKPLNKFITKLILIETRCLSQVLNHLDKWNQKYETSLNEPGFTGSVSTGTEQTR